MKIPFTKLFLIFGLSVLSIVGGAHNYMIPNFNNEKGDGRVLNSCTLGSTTIVITNVSCYSGNNGSATATPSGGTLPYTYAWTSGGGSNATASGLSAGTYTVNITDNNGCTGSATATISQPIQLNGIGVELVRVTCDGGNNGSAFASMRGGTPPYTYLWSPAGGTADTATGLTAGVYNIQVTDMNGCIHTPSALISEPLHLTALANITSYVSCVGGADGSASVTASFGKPAYTYSWSDANTQTTITATGLSAGMYTVNVTDSCGNTVSASVGVTSPVTVINFAYEKAVQNWTVPAGITQVTITLAGAAGGNSQNGGFMGNGGAGASFTGICNVTPGEKLSLVAGGRGGFGASKSGGGGGGSFVYDSNTLSLLIVGAGGGGGSVVDAYNGGYGGIDILTNVTTNGVGTTAPGGNSGNGGSGGYTNHGGAGGAGWLSNGGNVSGSPDSCKGGNDKANFFMGGAGSSYDNYGGYGGGGGGNFSGGGGGGGYNGGGGGASTNLSIGAGGGGGSYLNGTLVGNVVANNAGNGYVSITYLNLPLSIAISSQTNVLCFGGKGSATADSATGGVPHYTYSWSPNGGTNLTASNLTAGSYTVTATDNHGCTATASVIITQPSALSVSANVTANVLCNGGSNGGISSVVNGGTSPYTYLWSNLQNTPNITGLSAGTYTLNVTDNNGCTGSATVTITQPNALSVNANVTANVACNGGGNASASSVVSGGTLSYTYSWSDANTQTTIAATGLSAGIYTVTVTDACGSSATASATITQPAILAIVKGSVPASSVSNCDGSAWVNVSGGTVVYTYLWNPGGATTDTIKNQCAGSYCCTVTDANGCVDSVCVSINAPTGVNEVNAEGEKVKVFPNPNNGRFTIEVNSEKLKGNNVTEIYNSLGQKVYSSSLIPDSYRDHNSSFIIDLNGQSAGVYLYRITSENGDAISSGKFIIEK